MSLLGDGFNEFASLTGDTMTYYPHQGYQDGTDEFWHDDQGWDRTSGTTFTGILEVEPDDEELEAAGFDTDTESVIRTSFEGADDAGLVVVDGQEYVIKNIKEHRISGSDYLKIFAVMSHES